MVLPADLDHLSTADAALMREFLRTSVESNTSVTLTFGPNNAYVAIEYMDTHHRRKGARARNVASLVQPNMHR